MIGVNTYGLGVQLYEDFDGCMEQLKEIGFGAIEPCILSWGEAFDPAKKAGGRKLSDVPALNGMCLVEDAAERIEAIRKHGLEIRSIHFMGHYGDREGMEKAIQFAIDHDIHYFIHSFNVPTLEEIHAWIPYIKADIARLKEHGITMLMHNHEVEWTPDKGTTVFDELMKEVPDLGVQLDVGWTKFSKVDCIEVIKKYKDRIRIIHFKDVEEGAGVHNRNSCFTAVGEGSVPLREILALVPELDLDEVTEYVIDQDASKGDMMRDLRVGVENIRKYEV